MKAESQASGRARRSKSTFRLEYEVSINIKASPARIWSLLTTASEFPKWNSTVQSIEGQIALGQVIQLRATVAPTRVFKLKVSELVPEQRMVWNDGTAPIFTGVRTYTLRPQQDASTDFSMTEVFRGLMLPMIAGSLPDFGPIFEQYAADLKRAAEQG